MIVTLYFAICWSLCTCKYPELLPLHKSRWHYRVFFNVNSCRYILKSQIHDQDVYICVAKWKIPMKIKGKKTFNLKYVSKLLTGSLNIRINN